MRDTPRRLKFRVSLTLVSCFTFACSSLVSPGWAAASSTVDFLYRLAQEYRSRFLKPREGKVLKQMFA